MNAKTCKRLRRAAGHHHSNAVAKKYGRTEDGAVKLHPSCTKWKYQQLKKKIKNGEEVPVDAA